MNAKSILSLALLLAFTLSAVAQEKDYYGLESKEKSRFSFGFKVGAFFANPKSAVIYNGSPSSTQYGINHIFNQPFNQQVFDNYFKFPYAVVEFPVESRYQTTVELGVFINFRVNRLISFFVEFNTAVLDYENFFTVAIDDPTNRTPGPLYQQLPIIGEERRFNLNLGTHVSYFEENGTNAYFSLFANVNDTEMQRNYIVVDNINYEIFHQTDNSMNPRPGGIGVGFGAGTGLMFHFTDHILGDIYYNLTNTKAYFSENFQPVGFNHSIGIRVLWN